MEYLPYEFHQLMLHFSTAISTAPSAQSFLSVVLGWILCNGRHTLSGVIRAAGPLAPKSHDAYQNFFSKADWSMDTLWKILFLLLVKVFVTDTDGCQKIHMAGDDTLSKHYGRKIWGAGLYRDAVRSSKKHVVYAWGLNWVVLAMIVKVPRLKECYMALPIYARLNAKTDEEQTRKPSTGKRKKPCKAKGKGSKKKKTTVTLMEQMIRTVAGWLPEAEFEFCGDGAYACLVGRLPKNVKLVSRLRRDAKILAAQPRKRKGNRGRTPTKGERLPKPYEIAHKVGRRWKTDQIDMYGEVIELQLYTFNAVWYDVCSDRVIKIVIVRDPEGKVDDEFFFSTDLEMSPKDMVRCYTGRWAIEVVFRETKQYLGMDEPQARKKEAVLRITPFCLWLNSVIKLWFVLESRQSRQPTLLENDPWYTHKDTISFQDMLGALRLHFWQNYVFTGSTFRDDLAKIRNFLVKSLAKVA